MDSIKIQGYVDREHRLSASVPGSIPPGPINVWIAPINSEEDSVGDSWAADIAHEWADELSDIRQDIYTMADGDALDATP